MAQAWRIVKARLAARAFDGEGARLYGGRWNSPGTPLVYLTENRSLALLEILVHVGEAQLLESYVCFRIEYEANLCEELDPDLLPKDWRSSPPSFETQRVGDEWAASQRSLLLAVPSAVVPEERLVLLNPEHKGVARLTIHGPKPLPIDPRLG